MGHGVKAAIVWPPGRGSGIFACARRISVRLRPRGAVMFPHVKSRCSLPKAGGRALNPTASTAWSSSSRGFLAASRQPGRQKDPKISVTGSLLLRQSSAQYTNSVPLTHELPSPDRASTDTTQPKTCTGTHMDSGVLPVGVVVAGRGGCVLVPDGGLVLVLPG